MWHSNRKTRAHWLVASARLSPACAQCHHGAGMHHEITGRCDAMMAHATYCRCPGFTPSPGLERLAPGLYRSTRTVAEIAASAEQNPDL
jgi:hypothetical protein